MEYNLYTFTPPLENEKDQAYYIWHEGALFAGARNEQEAVNQLSSDLRSVFSVVKPPAEPPFPLTDNGAVAVHAACGQETE